MQPGTSQPCAGRPCHHQRPLAGAGAAPRSLHAGRDGLRLRRRPQQWRCQAVPAAAPAAAEKPAGIPDDDPSSPVAVRKYLASVGWEPSWIDGVIERIVKRQLVTSANKCKEVVEYLLAQGLTESQVCNMVSLCHSIIGHDVQSDLKPVVEFLTKQGVKDLPALLTQHPRLFDYKVSSNGKTLEKGGLRVAVNVLKEKAGQSVQVVIYREGAAFQTAPLSPWKPQ